jgi:transcriptional regulator
MYTPKAFEERREETLLQLCADYPFGTLVAALPDGTLEISHLPMLLVNHDTAGLRILTHVAAQNPMAQLASQACSMTAIFQGPHTYISPSSYVQPDQEVPTWNYAVVHAQGPSSILAGDELFAFLDCLATRFEGNSEQAWRFAGVKQAQRAELLRVIVGIAISVERFAGKLKLSQNRSKEDRDGVMRMLRARENRDDVAMLKLMSDLG